MTRQAVDRYSSSDSYHHAQWAREPGGRLLLPGEAARVRRIDALLGLVFVLAAIVLLCLDW